MPLELRAGFSPADQMIFAGFGSCGGNGAVAVRLAQ